MMTRADTACGRRPRLSFNPTSRAVLTVILASAVVGQVLFARGVGPVAAQAQPPEAFLAAARGAIAHGKPSEAESLARARGASDPDAAAILGRVAIGRGQYDEAARILGPVAGRDPRSEAALEHGLLLQLRGRAAEARTVLLGVARAAEGAARTADGLLRAARAVAALGDVDLANQLFRAASALRPGDPAIETAWGDMLAVKYQWGPASRSYQLALEKDANWAPAHLGMAIVLANEDPATAAAAARRALEIDPANVAAHLFLAELALDGDRRDDAQKAIDGALAVNPADPDAHALRGALAYLEGQNAGFEAAVARVAAVNPQNGEAYRVAAVHAARAYRFDEAVALARRAIALDPDSALAHADLGMHLLRAGDEAEARRALERSWDQDPYYPLTFNLLGLLDTLDTFATVRTGNVVLRMDQKEAPVLRHYAVPIVEQAMKSFGSRYGLEPRGPVLVEIFAKHDDFAVRTLGLPGLLGALGACFGRVVTLDSPRAREPGSFNWQATLWHELAHVFSLQLSNQRVPRWLTEGISVYEEGRVRPEWPRESELAFAQAYGLGKVLTLENLNGAFTRPDTVTLAYFQSYLAVDLLVDRHGEEGLRALLRAYGEALDTGAAFQKALGTDLGSLQKAYDARLKGRYAAVARALAVPEGVDLEADRAPDAWRALAGRHTGSFPVQMTAGAALARAGERDAAQAAFERAATLVPTATGAGSPRARLAALAEAAGDLPRAVKELSALVADDHTNLDAARALAHLATRTGNDTARTLAYEHIVMLDPFDGAAHTALGQIALARGDLPLALRELRAAVDAGPIDVVSARSDLADVLIQTGRYDEAKKHVLAALELAPTYPRAQELLLKIVEKK